MKQKIASIAVLLLLTALTSNATIRRVGFFANQIPNQDYFTFLAAYTAATNNDTILVFPGRSLGSITINKKLIIIGTGNWLDPNTSPKGNAGLQAFASTPGGGQLMFQSASAGSVVMGFDFNGSTIFVSADNITIKRNRDVIVNLAYNTNGAANAPFPVNNLQLVENYRLTVSDTYTGFSNTNINISNNLMTYLSLSTNSSFSGNIANNVWAYDGTAGASNGGAGSYSSATNIALAGGAWLFQNNILASYASASAPGNPNYFAFTGETNTVFNYNVALQTNTFASWGTGTGNIITPIANAASIFAAFPVIGSASADARYQLAANSPAKVANRPGSSIDAGIFSGVSPYKLSTIPSIPTVYLLTSPQGNNPAGNSIQFNVSTRGNN
ncbi:MAG: hypothetical protein V4717_15945 [Bacteroidota bacterium]